MRDKPAQPRPGSLAPMQVLNADLGHTLNADLGHTLAGDVRKGLFFLFSPSHSEMVPA